MRLPALLLILALCFATDLAFRWLWFRGAATPDPPLFFLCWLALADRRLRLHLAVFLVAVARVGGGIESFILAWLPVALTAEALRYASGIFNVREDWVRIPVAAGGVWLFHLFDGVLHSRAPGPLFLWSVEGAVIGGVACWLLFPIWDAVAPLLRSARYPRP